MKHPLTSKERRGLVAVAAAALLCIGSGFIFRSCSSRNAAHPPVVVIDNDSVGPACGNSVSDKSGKDSSQARKSGKSGKSERSRKSAKSRKSYPTRSPLDQPLE